MALKEHVLDVTNRVEALEKRLEEIESEKDKIEERARKAQEEADDEHEPLPDELEDRYGDLDAEQTQKKGERKKLIETVVVYDSSNNVVSKKPTECTDAERALTDVDWDEVVEIYGEIDNCIFVVEELTFGQLQGVSDDMMEESFEVDVEREEVEGTPKQGFYQIEFLREAIIEQPPNAPHYTDEYNNRHPEPAEYPIPLGEWLYDKVDAINTTGDTEMGNTSLREAIKSEN